jgi:omega-hydroxy-beta-dihydromenaquinone-9 sulfotransferase
MSRRWRFWHNYLSGISADRWRTLRAENRVDPGYRHRAALLAAMSGPNSFHQRLEERQYGAAIEQTRVEEPPLFILGHWRAGTTHLHALLGCDLRFASPSTVQASYPHQFLRREAAIRKQFAAFVPSTRPMDGMAMSADSPQEDEFALCLISLRSPYLGMFTFPRRADHYDRYLTFQGVPEPEVEEWRAALRWYAKKLTLRHGRRLLLKSPTHTARLRLLLELFPGAQFVHIHRDPYAVFQSNQHLFRSFPPLHYLQQPPDPDERILQRGARLYDAFLAEKELIPEGQLHELRFADLERDPVGQIAALYERLGLDGFEALRPRLLRHLESVAGYRKNRFPALAPTQRRRVASAWERIFDAWSYPTGVGHD